MNPAPLLLLSLGLAAGASVATTYLLRPASSNSQPTAHGSSDVDSLRAEIELLASEVSSLRAASDSTRLPSAVPSGRIDLGAIDQAVARYFEQHGGPAGAARVSVGEAAVVFDYEDALAQLQLGELDPTQRTDLWKKIREAGKLGEAIAWFEQNAEAKSNDPDAQVEVATAYLQKVLEVGDGPEAGLWAGKADSAYNRALELDTEHWDARFNKAIALSFWPPIFGKQAEAITNFETLIAQQQNGAPEAHHAQSYLLLGNLYTQTGQLDKAKGVWSQGYGLFPGNESLAGKLGVGQ